MNKENSNWYHWMFGKLKLVAPVQKRDSNDDVEFDIVDVGGIRLEDKKQEKEQNARVVFKFSAFNVWLFNSAEEVHQTRCCLADKVDRIHSMYDIDELTSHQKQYREKLQDDALEAENHESVLQTELGRLLEDDFIHSRRFSDNVSTHLKEIYHQLWDDAEEAKLNLCSIKKEGWTFDYSYPNHAMIYTYRYFARYVHDAAEFFFEVLRQNQNIRRIMIVGSGNLVDLHGLNLLLEAADVVRVFHVTTVEPVDWGYKPKLNQIPTIKHQHIQDKMQNVSPEVIGKQDLIVYSRVFNENIGCFDQDARTDVALTGVMVKEGGLTSAIFTTKTDQEDNYKGRLSTAIPDEYLKAVRVTVKDFELSMKNISFQNLGFIEFVEERCTQVKCKSNIECEASKPMYKSYSKYEVLIKKGEVLHDYFG